MSSPRVIASLIAISAAATLIASCGEQTSPTGASTVTTRTAFQSSAMEFVDMLADPTAPALRARGDDDDTSTSEDEPTSPMPTPPAPPQPEPTPADPPAPPVSTPAPPIVYPPGSATTPWPPGPPPRAQAGVPVPDPPTVSTKMHITITPEPVPHSGVPVPLAGCRDDRYTWYYDQVIVNDTGLAITLSAP